MRLTDLEPEWINEGEAPGSIRRASDAHQPAPGDLEHPTLREPAGRMETVYEAQGILFLCPVCFKKNGGPVGTESVLCWFRDRGVPDDRLPGPGRWVASGTGFGDLSLAPSVNVDNEHWHGFITNGEIVGGGV